MIETIILGLFSVLFAYLAKHENTRWGLKVSFTLIFVFLALRYDFGNDYGNYLDRFIEVDSLGQIDLLKEFEPGWTLLNSLFQPLGFFAMIAVLALVNCVVYYRFIVKYVPVSYYWLAIFLYIFYPCFMLVHTSAMRQSIAIMIFVYSLDFLCKKNAIRYFICIGLASLFHFTALILLPVYLLAIFNKKTPKAYGVIFVSIFISLFIFGETVSSYMNHFVSMLPDKYEVYDDMGVVNSGLGIIFFFALLILILYFERLQSSETALVFRVAVLSFLIMPLGMIIQMLARLKMYFEPATIIAYPIILMNLRNTISKTIFTTILIFFTIYQFFQFFYSDTYKNYFVTYKTILSAPQWY